MIHHGLIVVDKPQGITSRDAVDRAARWFPRKTKIGHAGTLDPLATGVLVVAVGHATRLIEYVQAMPKKYRTQIVLGATSDTDDADGAITVRADSKPPDEFILRSALDHFAGEIEQIPPAYSAAHVEGKRAYDLARRGNAVSLTARRVQIHQIDLLSYEWPHLNLEIACGKGTYIRSIARDLGAALGVGGYVAELRRLQIGQFRVEDAVPLDANLDTARQRLLPLAAAVSQLPAVQLNSEAIRRLRLGQGITASGTGEVAVFSENNELIAIGRFAGAMLNPIKVVPA